MLLSAGLRGYDLQTLQQQINTRIDFEGFFEQARR